MATLVAWKKDTPGYLYVVKYHGVKHRVYWSEGQARNFAKTREGAVIILYTMSEGELL